MALVGAVLDIFCTFFAIHVESIAHRLGRSRRKVNKMIFPKIRNSVNSSRTGNVKTKKMRRRLFFTSRSTSDCLPRWVGRGRVYSSLWRDGCVSVRNVHVLVAISSISQYKSAFFRIVSNCDMREREKEKRKERKRKTRFFKLSFVVERVLNLFVSTPHGHYYSHKQSIYTYTQSHTV